MIAASAALAIAGVAAAPAAHAGSTSGVNDMSCRPSAAHPYPVVFLHGLGATKDEDINVLQGDVAGKGYCTFALTYGVNSTTPWFGGLKPIAQSAAEIAAYIRQVLAATGAAKVDIVGHSEGGFQSLYVTKTQGISAHVDKVVAIAPPTHGTSFAYLWDIAVAGGPILTGTTQNLINLGCQACVDLSVGGSAVATLGNGPIAQPGVAYTVITSKYDELVTPTETSFVREPGVVNEYVQGTCSNDPVGHIGEAYDTNVWNLTENALDPSHAATFACSVGSPG